MGISFVVAPLPTVVKERKVMADSGGAKPVRKGSTDKSNKYFNNSKQNTETVQFLVKSIITYQMTFVKIFMNRFTFIYSKEQHKS